MKTREWLLLETLNVVKRVLTKGSAQQRLIPQHRKGYIVKQSVFRIPTKKEMAKHPKLLRKQRARFGGSLAVAMGV